ncbi:RNase adapter RapZ, partial [Siminovitchia fortis]|uniref:RNase adapter RapZ n=1 Tax=Siminovitchia fortis TaxID=254758 RepID=UPI0028CB2EDF
VLVRRYKERRGWDAVGGVGVGVEGIREEREVVEEVKGGGEDIYKRWEMKGKELGEKMVKMVFEMVFGG